jgi:hypothetical protein
MGAIMTVKDNYHYMAIKITKENYPKYKRIFEVFWMHYSQLMPGGTKGTLTS